MPLRLFFLVQITLGSESNTLLSKLVNYLVENVHNLFMGVFSTESSQIAASELGFVAKIGALFIALIMQVLIKLLIIACLVVGGFFILYAMLAFFFVVTQNKYCYTTTGFIKNMRAVFRRLFKKKKRELCLEDLFFAYSDAHTLLESGASVLAMKRGLVVNMQARVKKNTEYLNRMSKLMSKGYCRFALGLYWLAVAGFVFFLYVSPAWSEQLRAMLLLCGLVFVALVLVVLLRKRSAYW